MKKLNNKGYMLVEIILAFSICFVLYKFWNIDTTNWFLLAFRTFAIFALCMITYVIFAGVFKVEYVGELIERIKNYIKRKTIRK